MVIPVNGWMRHQLIEDLDGQEADDGRLPHAGRHLLHVGAEAAELHCGELAVLAGPGGREVVVGGGEAPGPALEDGASEQTPAQRRHQVVRRGEAPRRLPVDGDQAWVAAELSDVVSDPGERHHLVSHTCIAGNILDTEREEAEQTEAISDLSLHPRNEFFFNLT